jgi:FtsP/CotA-like multicopper oxidase with cupredoxin domain
MKKLLCILSLLMFGSLVFGQTTNLPPCDPNNLPPNCTDYFGVANWANSPLPAGAITGFTIKAAGSGYSSSIAAIITDTTGTGATAPTFTLDATGGLATVTGTGGGANYIAPQITVVDYGVGGTAAAPTCGAAPMPACGSGAVVLATIGAPLTAGTGMRKFLDPLPDLKTVIATADTTTFPGSDFYVIGLQQYTAKLHTDLPATTLRGYCQLTPPSYMTCTPGQPSYLGPTILAAKNRPVRVLFKNMLPIGTGGNLFIPTDSTYMGAGAPYTQNRATLHLHGGATPWISDGTPHQWTAPAGEAGPARGDSVQLVPDMWFDSTNGSVIAACAAQPTCAVANATNDPGPGNLTFFWTNQQGGRLMFYHDHAYGITRLNVYAGEAAGYLLYDPTEEAALLAAGVPGTLATNAVQTVADTAHLIPLVIQDKTFVPSAAQLAVEDPTWTAGGFGTIPGGANPGDLWFPHVYTTNQNPADPGGANAFGRWDYGPWTLPGNQTVLLAANPVTAVTIPCTSSAFPNQAVQCPITPNPSGTPEGFMDTPVVNGKAYPVMHVAPAAYRFRILSAGNDRSWNLSWYVADPTVTTVDGRTNTEVKMLPAVQPSGATGTLPLCTQITPITNTTLFMGLATALLDGSGNPLNGTGLPSGCWPNFGAGSQTAGIPVQQTMWAADGRAGGVPDPTTAGPPWIEIGTEGGLLPAPVVIPAMPVGYEANTRSVTITNVSVHGLWLGPAERADAVVDFSKFAGKTLILYNDAPTPAPAVDSRLDYFTGDGDQTPIGGAPNTIAGFGPNTRTIMQVVVDPVAPNNTVPFNMSVLQGALPSIFAQTQPVPIVPEPTYPPASGGYSPTLTYSLISDATLTWFPIGSTTPVTYTDDRKTIQELFTVDYGRMNATLGVELPLTTFLNQTTIPLGYIDPPTEILKDGETQLWHITHNGVDTHFIHFHLFNVQVINRSGWDGTVRPIDQNELGWKDTVRMNPLEDILVALQPIRPVLPFPLRDSYRLLDVTMPANSDCPAPTSGLSPLPCSIFTDVNPANNNPVNTPNRVQNFGWEYVWHCHILGHEENDMMRAIAFNVAPEAPSSLTVAAATGGGTGLNLTWTDNSASETGFNLERASDSAFTQGLSLVDISAGSTLLSPPQKLDNAVNGQGIMWGETLTYNDMNATGTGPYFYRVQAYKPDAAYWTPGPNITSAWSNTATLGATAAISPAALAFGIVAIGSTSPSQTVTISNTGSGPLGFPTLVISPNFTTPTNVCSNPLLALSSCTLTVAFTPTASGPVTGTLTIGTSDPANPTLTVSLTGAGGANPLLTVTANNTTMKYGSKVPVLTASYSPANPAGMTTPATCTTTATSNSPVGSYPITCVGAVDPNYTITYVMGTVTVTPVPLTIWGSNVTMLAGTAPPAILPLFVGFVAGDSAASLTTAPTCNAWQVPPPPLPPTLVSATTPVGKYPTICSGAVDPNYTISYVNGTITVNTGQLMITAPTFTMTYGGPVQSPLTPTYTVNGVVTIPPITGLTTPPVCNTSVTIKSPVGTYPGAIVCSGAVDPSFSITYTAGNVTVTPAALTITAPSPTMTYGGPLPALTPTYATFVAGDTAANLTTQPTCTTMATVSSPVGAYPVTCTGAVDPNYAISYVAGTLTVTSAPLTITAGGGTMVYGGTVPTITPSYSGFVNGQNSSIVTPAPTCSTTATSASSVGSYPSTCTGAAAANYAISYVPGTVTVTGAPLVITASSGTMVYGGTVPTITSTFSGFVNGQNSSVLTTQPTCSTTATPTSNVGSYPSTCLGAVAVNYSFTYVAGTVTVTQAPVTITASSPTMIYGGPVPAISASFSGFLNGQNSSVLTTQPICSTVATSTTNAGSYASTCAGAAAVNYLFTYVAGAVTVNKAASTTTITSNTPSPAILGQVVTVNVSVAPQFTGTPIGTVMVRASTGETCNASVTGTGSCTLTFFTGGPRTLTASYGGNANFLASPVSLPVTQLVSGISLSTISLLFGDQVVGTPSASQTVTISNVGITTITGISFAWSANFSDSTNCGTSLAPGRSCRVNVRFIPTTTGVLTGFLTITNSDPTSPQRVSLTGTGVQPAAVLSPSAVPFGTIPRRTNKTLPVTLSNPGTAPLTINGISASGRFSQTNNCGASLAIGATCTINVTFSSNTAGTFTGTLTVRDSAPGTPQTATLSGTAQ